MGPWTYFLSIVLFCGPLILVGWKVEIAIFRKYEKALVILVAISIPFAGAADFTAEQWGTWQFSAVNTSNLYIPTLPESYLFSAVVTFIVAVVTLAWARKIDRKRLARSTATRPPRLSRAKPSSSRAQRRKAS